MFHKNIFAFEQIWDKQHYLFLVLGVISLIKNAQTSINRMQENYSPLLIIATKKQMLSSPECFQYAGNCSQSSLSLGNHTLQPHSEISHQDLCEILKANVESFSYRPFLEAQRKLILSLNQLKSKVTDLIKRTEKNLTQLKLASVMQLEEEKMIEFVTAVLKNDKMLIKDISCSDMQKIVSNIQSSLNYENIDGSGLMKKLCILSNGIEKQVADFTKEFAVKISPPTLTTSKNPEKQPSTTILAQNKKCDQQQIYLDQDDEIENRNTKNIMVKKTEKFAVKRLDHRNHFCMFDSDQDQYGSEEQPSVKDPNSGSFQERSDSQNNQNSNDSSQASSVGIGFEKQGNGFKFVPLEKMGKVKQRKEKIITKLEREEDNSPYSPKCLKIKDLQHYPVEEHFNIRLKVLKIIKEFEMNGAMNVEFNGGDETGIAVCVMKKNSEIVKGNSIYVTNCRIYIFKNKIKQIQTSSSSKFYQSKYDVENIHFLFNFTQESELTLRKGRNIRGNKNNLNRKKKLIQLEINKNGMLMVNGGCVKIGEIEPSDKAISFYAQVVKVIEDGLSIRCVLGDNSGIINAELPVSLMFIKEGIALKLDNVIADVVNSHTLIVVQEGVSRVTHLPDVRLKVDESNNISEIEWLEEYQLADEEDQDEGSVDSNHDHRLQPKNNQLMKVEEQQQSSQGALEEQIDQTTKNNLDFAQIIDEESQSQDSDQDSDDLI